MMQNSKIIPVLLVALALCGCDQNSTVVGTVTGGGVGALVQLYVALLGCQGPGNNFCPPDQEVNIEAPEPAANSELAPYTIWVAEANSGTAMSKVSFDPLSPSAATAVAVNMFPGIHATGITSWLGDSSQPQYGLYLWHDNTIEVMSTAAVPLGSMKVPVSGTISDFGVTDQGLTGFAFVKGDTHVFLFDLVARKYKQSIDLGVRANPGAGFDASDFNGSTSLWVTDAVNGDLYRILGQSVDSFGGFLKATQPAELGKAAVTPDHDWFWIPNVTQNSIMVFHTSGLFAITFKLDNLFDPREIVLSRDGKTAYILFSPPASFGRGALAAVDVDTRQFKFSVPLGIQPSGLVLSPQGSYMFVANAGDGNVAVINSSGKVTNYSVGQTPVGVVALH